LIHNRLSKLEEGQLMVKRNRVIHSFLAENNPTALKNYLEWEATKHEAGRSTPCWALNFPAESRTGRRRKVGHTRKTGRAGSTAR
jgi:hypothetical protein